MTAPRVFRVRSSDTVYHSIIDCIGKYFLIEKMAFLSTPFTYFHEVQIS